MARYNVDFFDRNTLANLHHDGVASITVDDDSISINASSLDIGRTDAITKGSFVFISGGGVEFLGVVSDIDNSTDGITRVSYKSFVSLFDTDVLFDTDLQGTSTLEAVISNLITTNFVDTGDSFQNLPMTLSTTSSRSTWGFNLKSEKEGMHHVICNLFSAIISKAMSSYRTGIRAVPDFANGTIAVEIGTVTGTKHIDADLPNVKIKTFKIREANSSVNKLVVYDSSDYSNYATYYLHTDGSYDTSDSDRVTPVVQAVKSVDSTQDTTFAQAAASTAASELGGIEWSNLIELEVSKDDALINPLALEFGQTAYIYHDGVRYHSILTGRAISDTVTLSFGTVRTKLTKRLKLGG